MWVEDLSRRTFLERAGQSLAMAGALGAAAASPDDAEAQQQQPQQQNGIEQLKEPLPIDPDRRLGWAVVGIGDFALNQIIPSFAECKHSRLAALVSGDRQKAAKLAAAYGVSQKNIYGYEGFDSLRDNPEVDVVYNILPNSMHAEYSIRALKAGKHVLCEKPMANSVADCERMIAAAREAKRKLMIAYRAQYEPFNLAAIEIARSKELGALKVIVADHGRNLNPEEPRDRWRTKKELAGGGSLVDIGIYSLNATRYLTGEEPIEISAQTFSTPNDPRFKEVEETINFILRFPSGVLANCTSSYGFAEVKRFRGFCERGWFELDPATDYYEHNLHVGRKGADPEKVKEVIEERKVKKENQFAAEMDHFSECIRDDKTPRTPGEEGLRDVRLISLIYEAARTGRTVRAPAEVKG